MPKRKLDAGDKNVIRQTLKDGLAKGEKVIDLVTSLSGKYKVTPETIRYYLKAVKENRPVRGPGRPKGSGKKAAAPAGPKRGPGRPRKNPVAVAAPKRGPGRPRKNPAAAAAAPKRGPGRPRKAASAGGIFLLDARAAEIVLRAGGRETTVARVVYQDEAKLVDSILKTLSTLQG